MGVETQNLVAAPMTKQQQKDSIWKDVGVKLPNLAVVWTVLKQLTVKTLKVAIPFLLIHKVNYS